MFRPFLPFAVLCVVYMQICILGMKRPWDERTSVPAKGELLFRRRNDSGQKIASNVNIEANDIEHTHRPNTHRPHDGHARTTPEPYEREHFNFKYEPSSHQMTITTGHICYIVKLSDSERTAVHSNIGLRTLELKLIGLLGTSTKTEVQKTDLDQHLVHACGMQNVTNFYQMTV